MPVQAIDVQCRREDLLVALQAAEAVVPSSNIKKILTNLRIDVQNDHMVISATDQQVGLRALVRRIQVQTVGSLLVPTRQLVPILKESRSNDVHLQVVEVKDSQQLQIGLQDGQYNLPVFTSDEFPVIGGYPDQADSIPVPAQQLERMIRCTIFAVDKDRSSAVLSGVYCALHEGELLLTATDGKVLCEARHGSEAYAAMGDIAVVIPAQTVIHLSRLLAGNQAEVAMAVERGLIFIRAVIAGADDQTPIQIELTSRLVEGVYPSYRNAIPTQSESAISFESSALATAVRRTALMTSSANRGIVMAVDDGRAVLSNFSHSTGTAEIPVPCEYTGQNQRIGLNAGYMQEVLRVYTRDEITIELNGPGRGMLMRDDDVTFLIMPITLPN